MEVWKEIHGYNERYEVSNYGRVRSNDMIINGRLHRLVAAAFVPNPENKPCVDHIDGDRANNHADNLRWSTRKQNANNPITRKRVAVSKIGERNPNYKK